MTEQEWDALTDDDRELVLTTILDTQHIAADQRFGALPYWLRRHITHFVRPLANGTVLVLDGEQVKD